MQMNMGIDDCEEEWTDLASDSEFIEEDGELLWGDSLAPHDVEGLGHYHPSIAGKGAGNAETCRGESHQDAVLCLLCIKEICRVENEALCGDASKEGEVFPKYVDECTRQRANVMSTLCMDRGCADSFLVSGARDGTVSMWVLRVPAAEIMSKISVDNKTGNVQHSHSLRAVLVSTFRAHSGAVAGLSVAPLSAYKSATGTMGAAAFGRLVCSIGANDDTLVVYRIIPPKLSSSQEKSHYGGESDAALLSQLELEEVTVEQLYVLPACGKTVIGLHWKLTLGFLMATCVDKTISVWSLASGRLEHVDIPDFETFELLREGGSNGTTWVNLPKSSEGQDMDRRKFESTAHFLEIAATAKGGDGAKSRSTGGGVVHDPAMLRPNPTSSNIAAALPVNDSFESGEANLHNGGGIAANVEEFVRSFRQPAGSFGGRSNQVGDKTSLPFGQESVFKSDGHSDFAKVVSVSTSPNKTLSNMNTIVTDCFGFTEYGNELCSGLAPTALAEELRVDVIRGGLSDEHLGAEAKTMFVLPRPAVQVLMVNIECLSNRLKAKLSRESNSQGSSPQEPLPPPLPPRSATMTTPKKVSVHAGSAHLEKDKKCFRSLEQVVMSCILVWGLDDGIDRLCGVLLGLDPPSPRVAFGHHGAGNAMTLLAPGRCSGWARWTLSPFLSAVMTMAVMSLSMALMQSHPSFQALFGSILPLYATVTPEKLLKSHHNFTEPSLTLLSQYSLMTWEEGHLTARQLLEATLNRRGSYARQAIAAEWSRRLHSTLLNARQKDDDLVAHHSSLWGDKEVGLGDTECDMLFDRYGDDKQRQQKHQSHLVLVLTVVGLLEPNAIDASTAKHTTAILMTQLHSDVVSSALAIELLSKGLHMWRPHIANLPSLIWSLLQLSASSDPTDAEIEEKNRPRIRALVALSNAAQKTVSDLCVMDVTCFLKTVFVEVRNPSASISIRQRVVRCLVSLVSRQTQSVRLIPHLSSIVEVVMRVIDPQRPGVRKHCLAICQRLLSEILKRFPMCTFHPPTQRFAVGAYSDVLKAKYASLFKADAELHHLDRLFIAIPGSQMHSITIYDLRTASKWRVFDGHDSPISCVSFAPSGDLLASYSAADSNVRTWKSGTPGFFGSFQSIQTSHIKNVDLGVVTKDAISPTHALNSCKIDWQTSSSFKLTRENGVQVNIYAQ